MLTVLVILSVLCIVSYTAAVCIKFGGVPESISATFYSLQHKYWFGATMWITAFLLMPAILEVTPSNYQFVAFLSCLGMFLVGAAPNFREWLDKKVHKAGAIMCVSLSQIWVALICPFALFAWLAYIAYTAWIMKKKWKGNFISAFLLTKPMFWIEIAALFTTYLSLFLEI